MRIILPGEEQQEDVLRLSLVRQDGTVYLVDKDNTGKIIPGGYLIGIRPDGTIRGMDGYHWRYQSGSIKAVNGKRTAKNENRGY